MSNKNNARRQEPKYAVLIKVARPIVLKRFSNNKQITEKNC